MEVSSSLAERLYDKVHELNDFGILAFGMLPGIVKNLPDRIGSTCLLMSSGLVSDDREIAQNVIVTLHRWMIWAADVKLGMVPVPAQLVRDVGISIAARRQAVVAQALGCTKWILGEGSDEQREIIGDLAIRGLGHLIEELRYDREDAVDGGLDVPLVRWRCIGSRASFGQRGEERRSCGARVAGNGDGRSIAGGATCGRAVVSRGSRYGGIGGAYARRTLPDAARKGSFE